MALRRAVLTGGECTGKTTLARALAARYRTAFSEEAARVVAASKPGALGAEDVAAIARTHVRLADEAVFRAEVARAVAVFFDQDLFSTVVYARHYYGSCPPWIERLASERRADLYLLCVPDLPWAADGIRDRPTARGEMHARFEEILVAAGARIREVSGAGPDREVRAARAVDELLSTR